MDWRDTLKALIEVEKPKRKKWKAWVKKNSTPFGFLTEEQREMVKKYLEEGK